MAKKGNKPKYFEVVSLDTTGKQEIKIVTTLELHRMITELNSRNNKRTLVITKTVKQSEAFEIVNERIAIVDVTVVKP